MTKAEKPDSISLRMFAVKIPKQTENASVYIAQKNIKKDGVHYGSRSAILNGVPNGPP